MKLSKAHSAKLASGHELFYSKRERKRGISVVERGEGLHNKMIEEEHNSTWHFFLSAFMSWLTKAGGSGGCDKGNRRKITCKIMDNKKLKRVVSFFLKHVDNRQENTSSTKSHRGLVSVS